jgi:hypothetical protein
METAWQIVIRLPRSLEGLRVLSGKFSGSFMNLTANGNVFSRDASRIASEI